MTAFDRAWDMAKAHPNARRARRALEEGTASPSYISVMGNKGSDLHTALNRFLYSQSRLGRSGNMVNRRLIEPFMGGLDVGFAVRPDEGLFANDRDPILPLLAETVRDRPEALDFDPRWFLTYPGDELSIYDRPDGRKVRGKREVNFDPLHTVEFTESDLAEVPEDRRYEGGAYLPMKYYQRRAETNKLLDQFRRGELGAQGRDELLRNTLGMSRALNNSILRYGSRLGLINSAAGAKDDKAPILMPAAQRMVAQIQADTGDPERRGVGGLKPEKGPTFRPQSINQISQDESGKGDLSPYDLTPWSEMMQDWHFTHGMDFRDFMGDISFARSPLSGDYVVQDPPYGEETGQHSLWTPKDTNEVYDWARRLGEMDVPNVVYNDASPTTIDAIKRNNLPLSLILSRLDRGRAGTTKQKPESVTTYGIPALEGRDLSTAFAERFGRGFTADQETTDWPTEPWVSDKLDTAEMEYEHPMPEEEVNPATYNIEGGGRSWITLPDETARILGQPRYGRSVI